MWRVAFYLILSALILWVWWENALDWRQRQSLWQWGLSASASLGDWLLSWTRL